MTVKALKKDPLNLIVAGVGGQGNIVISALIGTALVNKGWFVIVGETFGAAQRGGAVMSHIRISKETQYGPLIPEGCADIILGMEPVETLRVLGQFGNPDVATIVNPRPVYPLSVLSGEAEYPDSDWLMETIKDLPKGLAKARELAKKYGIEFKSVLYTMGEYDAAVAVEAPNDEAVAKHLLEFGSLGLIRTKTLKAFTPDEYIKLIGEL